MSFLSSSSSFLEAVSLMNLRMFLKERGTLRRWEMKRPGMRTRAKKVKTIENIYTIFVLSLFQYFRTEALDYELKEVRVQRRTWLMERFPARYLSLLDATQRQVLRRFNTILRHLNILNGFGMWFAY